MASIFTAHRLLLQRDSLRLNRSRNGSDVTSSPPNKKTVIFGFPYADTLHVLQEFNETYFLGRRR
ncbi:CPA_1a_G0040140.mRNA.1.CDS.1 [Saccharomyces cerevisiae]|nr:CPA_1a_G0040140.mRNA.1.CDS.1 [Saccharomyces cerevisiae]CAI7421875.1 CPA_1a_G0040140.mRNA.1.CDS.1 [Saccharomyces cerevisiae]